MECDLLCVDAPYGADTHAANVADKLNPYRRSTHSSHSNGEGGGRKYETNGQGGRGDWSYERRALNYAGWTPDDVRAFVDHWSPRTRGWMVSITSHDLAPVWAEAMAANDRYVFAPLPWVAPGSRVRLAGDGPSSWTCWIIVARPRTGNDRNGRPYSKWGTLPGAYVITSDRGSHIGGKPLALMEALVRDYSRPGDLVCDPCAGYGTTLAAALRQGRRAIGSEMDPETHAKGLEYLDRNGRARDLFEAVEQVTAAQELPW